MNKAHILNGDSLKLQLHDVLNEAPIVAREGLIDGNVQGQSLAEFYANRAGFIAEYDGFEVKDYYAKTVPELEKIKALPANSEVVCWFEDDLFCQANFWFVMYLLVRFAKVNHIELVRPSKGNEYSFGDMSAKALEYAYTQRYLLTIEEITLLAKLWPLYQQNNTAEMLVIASSLKTTLPFLIPAINAQQQRQPDASGLGLPERTLLAIMQQLNSQEFSVVFKEFSKRMAIYSFGDIQVKRMFDKLINEQ